MYYTRKFLTYLLANTTVMYAAHTYAGNFMMFGRAEIGVTQAILTTAFGLTLAAMFVDLLLKDFSIELKPDTYLSLELCVNIATLYVLARTALQNSVGVGITAFWVAIITGIVLSIAQYAVKLVTDTKPKKS